MEKKAKIVMLLGIFSLRICFAASAFLNRSTVDELSLLSMKANINSDILARNWSKETSFCTWTGITCGKEQPLRVTAINLPNMGLEGTIAKEIGNLSYLRFLDISNNSINGLIPGEVGNLRQLRVLKMAFNQLGDGIPQNLGLLRKLQGLNLSNNNLIGVIPTSLSGCVELKMLDLSHNNLSGNVPAGFWNWSQLEELSLSRNYLAGTIPASIGNLTNLEVFDISRNNFYGTVVSEMGQLSSLRILNLQTNNLSGEVPQAIFNLSKLQFLSLRENNLSGSLPFSIDRGLPNIEHIFIGNIERRFNLRANQFFGKIPNSISNLSKLITLDLSDNSFYHVPIDLGSLHQLQMLNLQANQLMNNLSNPGQDFLSSLAACKNLKSIQISFNPIIGVLPKSLGSSNLSASLETLKGFSCRLSYPIPDEIGNLSKLLWLDLGYNHFTGAIPSTLGQLRSLRNLGIYGNRFHGSISPVLCNLKHLYSLNVAMNNLSGQLPSCFGNLSSLREIYMSDNEFSGDIDSFLWFLKGVSNVKSPVALDLSRNQLSGKIPSTISQLENLVRLSLSSNKLKGPIVESFTVLKDLQYLDLSHNNLSGSIPKSLEALSHLNYFDVSFNELRGEIPDRGCFVNFTAEFFIGNDGLCGPPRFEVKKCQSLSMRKHLSYLSFLIVLVLSFILVLVWKFCARKPYTSSDYFPYPCSFNKIISYHEILHATCNFHDRNLIGRGGIGSVYRGIFSDGSVYAVKVFDLDVQGALKSFSSECEVLSRVCHRNLVKIITCCSQIDFKALLMTYMPNGDLETWLHSASYSLDLFTGLRIMIEVAHAIQYLHEFSSATIVHCDLNPKNILLDEDMVAHVGDFGISKLLSQEDRMLHSRTLGTVGYIAPEYGSQGLITTTVDVYSYGILLMEMLSRKKPTDEMFSGELTLRRWVSESFPDSILQSLDNEMLDTIDEEARPIFITCLTLAIELALGCTADLPEERPSMTYVLNRMTYVVSSMRKIQIQLNNPEKNKSYNNGAAREAEHTIASAISEENPSHCGAAFAGKSKFKRQMKMIMQQTDSITMEVRNMKDNKAATIKDAVQLGASSSAAGLPSRLSPISKTDSMVGLHEDLMAIKYRLCGESSNLQVIPICGMGGIGKTTLAKSVYDDPLMLQHFDIRGWVRVSQDYSADVILSELLASMKEFDKERCEESGELVGEKVYKILKSRRYLIIIDDIWSVEAWDEIRIILPDDGNGSRVMLTSRLIDVAAYPDPYSSLHMMRLMDEDQSCDLLRQKVFGHQDCPLELERIVEEIARNCRGLPLAVVVVAGILSAVGENPASWKDIAEDVKSIVTLNGQFEDILSLSYTHLPHYLRSCFLYMGMFPEDHEIRVSKLIKLWVAENFVRCTNGSKSLEEEAGECLEDLVRRNLVLVNKRKLDGKMKSCSLHDLMRELCVRKAHEGKFFLNFRSWHDRRYIPLAIRENQCRVSVAPSSLPYLSKIDSLTIHTILCFHDNSVANMLLRFRLLSFDDNFVANMLLRFRLLKVLDIGDVYVRSLPYGLFDLFHLVYLAIYYLETIPAAIAKLCNLQTLHLHAKNEWRLFRDHSVCLPQEIWMMPQLRHLVFYGRLPDPEGRTNPSLDNLQTLSVVSHAMCSERILRMIRNLKKLEIDCSDCRPGEICLNNLVHLRQLEDLKLRSSFSNAFCQKDIFTFPRMLKKLTLSRVPLPWDEMTVVGSLPNLRVLKLTHQACKGNTWETIEGEFSLLEFLLIEKSDLEHWITESSHFPMLKSLVLDDCWHLVEIPEGIGEIPTLELIEVKGKAEMSLVESAKRILEEQREWGNDTLQVRCLTHR